MSETPTIEIDVQATSQLLQKHSSEEFLLLDCREPDEHKNCRIEGSKLIPMRLVHCHHGGRSLRVVEFLRENGFPQAQNMAGGIDVWSQEIDNSVPRY